MRANCLLLAAFAALATAASAQISAIRVPIDATRSRDDAMTKAGSAVLQAQNNISQLIAKSRTLKGLYNPAFKKQPFIAPMVVRFTKSNQDIASPALLPGSTPVTLVFDSTGSGAFTSDYQTLLQNVFNAAQPTINLVFGQPSVGGQVHVVNFDTQIGDRQAVTGGFFVPGSGSTLPEIRFPVYSNPEAAAVNFIHTILLAYLGNDSYAFDAFQEGLVRAATMRIVRTPGALASGLDPSQVEQVLQNSYDVGAFYSWYNQPGLEGPTFIAPNLLTVPLPSGGSVGGPYLLKYRMGGSAWQKVLVEYPTFIAGLNAKLYATPSIGSNPAAIIQAGQSVMNTIAGSPTATVEGFSLSEWVKRQYILHVQTTRGQKVLVEPTPITSGLSGTDFGVFLIETHYFSTTGANQEALLSGTSFPIFWEGDNVLNRIFPSAQEDRMDIAGAYGAVTPNLPDLNSGVQYRVTTDIPVGDQLERVYLPAGSIATASHQTANNFFGTVIGLLTTNPTVRARIGNTILGTFPIQNGAFGGQIVNSAFIGYAPIVVDVGSLVGGVFSSLDSQQFNKGPGSLAVDFRMHGEATFQPEGGTIPKGLSAFGFPAQPYIDYEPNTLGILSPNTLVARFNPSRATYDLFPEIEAFHIGHAYFVNMANDTPVSVVCRTHPGMAVSVACKPGWNLITLPKMNSITVNGVQVVHAADFPKVWTEATGTDIGTDYFRFVPGPNDVATGAPETGSFVAVTDNAFHPGQAYYVRVLDPEGVTLNFNAANAISAVAMPALTTQTSGWQVRCQVVTPTNASSFAIIGENPKATDGFDNKFDSGIPPSMGGLQVVAQGTERMFRDIRSQGLLSEGYKLHIEGLSPGVKYQLRLSMLQGAVPYYTLYDPAASYRKPGWVPATYYFTATTTTRDITLILPGGIK